MKFFIDSADIKEIRQIAETGLVDGVTTNPSLVANTGRNFLKVLHDICDVVKGPVSAEVIGPFFSKMVDEGHKLAAIADNICVKVPLTPEGLKACRELTNGTAPVQVNVTLCFSPAQAILAAKAGATYVSPFVGRLDDVGGDGMQLIADIVEIYKQYPDFTTEVLVASIRSPKQVVEAAKLGAHVVTVPPKILQQMYEHPLTDSGLVKFLHDWDNTGQSILK